MVTQRPIVIPNPRLDAEFRYAIERELDDGVAEPAELERRLRLAYPKAVVRARDLAGERLEIWYVYREGRWVADGPP